MHLWHVKGGLQPPSLQAAGLVGPPELSEFLHRITKAWVLCQVQLPDGCQTEGTQAVSLCELREGMTPTPVCRALVHRQLSVRASLLMPVT